MAKLHAKLTRGECKGTFFVMRFDIGVVREEEGDATREIV
jgi:hypothetical protein